MHKNFNPDTEWRSCVPNPICDAYPGFDEIYWKAWELAHEHIVEVPGMPQTPYMDEAFCDTDIWIWDSCFMALFCKYAQNRFPGIETLENFYQVLYGNKRLPVIITRNAPAWTGEVIGQPARMRIHLLDNPPLFAWAEYCNALFHGSQEHVRNLLERSVLQKHFQRLETLQDQYMDENLRACTCLRRHPLGYFWEGARSGMDNTPRGRTGEHAWAERPGNPRMLWVDALAQQGLSALNISRLATLTGKTSLAEDWLGKYRECERLVNQHYWDETDGFYYDIDADTRNFLRVMTPASFWPVLAEMAAPEQVDRMCEKLEDPEKLGGQVPCLSLARDDADFRADGHYWRGSLWIPTAYMVIKGIEKYGKFTLARRLATRIIRHILATYQNFEPHTIWECYSPMETSPAMSCDNPPELVRKDFCGWSALAPIALLLENVIGIHAVDAFARRLDWRLDLQTPGRLGVERLRFGDTITTLVYENGICRVESNQPYMLHINDMEYDIHPGGQVLAVLPRKPKSVSMSCHCRTAVNVLQP